MRAAALRRRRSRTAWWLPEGLGGLKVEEEVTHLRADGEFNVALPDQKRREEEDERAFVCVHKNKTSGWSF